MTYFLLHKHKVIGLIYNFVCFNLISSIYYVAINGIRNWTELREVFSHCHVLNPYVNVNPSFNVYAYIIWCYFPIICALLFVITKGGFNHKKRQRCNATRISGFSAAYPSNSYKQSIHRKMEKDKFKIFPPNKIKNILK